MQKRTKRLTVSIIFLLLLYIVPITFMPSSNHLTTFSDPKMNREFETTADWYNYDWKFRKNITLTGSAGAGTDYPLKVTVTYNAHMQADFDDLRFADNDGITLLDYWRASYTASTSAIFWVKVTDDLSSNQLIYMYYGNSNASYIGNGHDVFIFFDDFETGDFSYWTVNESKWNVQSSIVKHGTYAAYGDSGDPASRKVEKTLSSALTTSFMIHTWCRFQTITGTEYPIISFDSVATTQYAMYSPLNEFSTYDGTQKDYFTNGQVASTWQELEIGFDLSASKLFRPYIDGVHKTDRSLLDSTAHVITNVSSIDSILSTNINQDHWIDDFYVRKWIATEPSISSFGAEESTMSWHEVSVAEIVFIVPLDMTVLNGLYILLGMGMVVASGLYLVKGGKNEVSMNKVYFAIVAFMIGWALIIGGILP